MIGGLRQEWSVPFDGGRSTCTSTRFRRAIARPHRAAAGRRHRPGFPRTGDVIHLGATIDGERVQLAEVDGRFLSSEMTESFTGRVYGPYAVSGTVSVIRFQAEGDDE